MQSKLTPYALTDSATIAVDWNNSHNQYVTVAGNRTLTFSNPVAGSIYSVKITQDSTGSRTITWPSTVKWAGGSAPTLTTTASRSDVIYFLYDGTNYLDISIKKDHNLA
jgi:hypothetical protein